MIFQNKKILLVGLGGFKKGSGVSAAEFLASRGANLTITDLKKERELATNLAVLKKYKDIKYILGEHHESNFAQAEWVVRNPDVPPSSPFLTIARQKNIPIDNDITLFFREYGVERVIGVTGTRGKSTTTALIHAMAQQQFKQAKLGGNIGESPLRFLAAAQKHQAPVVLELSNFQLSDLDTIKMSPHVAVWTNLYPDHLNKYPSMKEYQADKMKIFKYQKAGDAAVINWDNEITKKIGQQLQKRGPAGRKVLFFSLKKKPHDGAYLKNGWFVMVEDKKEIKVCPITATKLLGEHNLSNTLAAICASRGYGVSLPAIAKAIKTFAGVPNRLEFIREIEGVKYINDCTATSPQATLAALKSFPAKKIILITGGNSKGSPLEEMARLIKAKTKIVILMPGKVNEELKKMLGRNKAIYEVENLKLAVQTAWGFAEKGDVILLSPGLTWLPRQNEFARGEEFKKIVKKIRE